MRLLLDSHILLWWQADSPALSKAARSLLMDSANEIYISVASLWEISIKSGKGKLEANPEEVLAQVEMDGFVVLPIVVRHVLSLGKLDAYHGDPFDRVLVAQALSEPMRLVTHDKTLAQYGESIMLV